jgi:hypothetical protein
MGLVKSKFMKTLLTLFVLFFSSLVFAGVGDVYYCETEKFIVTTKDESTEYPPLKFKFKRNKDTINFGEGGYFENLVMTVIFSADLYFEGGDDWNRFIFVEDLFVYSALLNTGEEHRVISVVATCDTF